MAPNGSPFLETICLWVADLWFEVRRWRFREVQREGLRTFDLKPCCWWLKLNDHHVGNSWNPLNSRINHQPQLMISKEVGQQQLLLRVWKQSWTKLARLVASKKRAYGFSWLKHPKSIERSPQNMATRSKPALIESSIFCIFVYHQWSICTNVLKSFVRIAVISECSI